MTSPISRPPYLPDLRLGRLAEAVSRLVDECYLRTYAYPSIIIPPEHSDLTEVCGVKVLPNATAAPGWVLAQARDGAITAVSLTDSDAEIRQGAHVARFVGGPLDGRLEAFPATPPISYYCTVLGHTWAREVGAAPDPTSAYAYRYSNEGRSVDGYWAMMARGQG